MTDLDRLLELYLLQKHSRENNLPNFIEEYKSLKSEINAQLEKGQNWDNMIESYSVKKDDVVMAIIDTPKMIKELESKVAKLEEELQTVKYERVDLHSRCHKLEQYKKALDEIKEWFDTPYKRGHLPERIKAIIDKHEGKK